jgi:hypothetical protein
VENARKARRRLARRVINQRRELRLLNRAYESLSLRVGDLMQQRDRARLELLEAQQNALHARVDPSDPNLAVLLPQLLSRL